MMLKIALPLLAGVMAGYAVLHVVRNSPQPTSAPDAVAEPERDAGADGIAASGIVEAQTENIAVGSPTPGIVTQVHVHAGQRVKVGDALFDLDDREVRADLKCQDANLAAAEAQLARLENQPREEELPVAEARGREAAASLRLARDQLDRERRLGADHASSTESLVRREQEVCMARERLERVEAELKLLRAGAWKYDKGVARAAVVQARSQVERVKTRLERLTVRARIDGEILRVGVRPGEYVATPPGRPLVLLGNVEPLHVRVNIDEHDSPRFRPGMAARARLKGESATEFALTFVRVEPVVVPKPSLTGSNTERTDTRVLQVIYAVQTHSEALYVGQQVDVVILDRP